MNLEFIELANQGDAERERIVLRATDRVDIGDYAVLMARRSSNGKPLSGPTVNCFWFEDKFVETGATVVLYTKSGKRSIKKNANGVSSYFYYWGLDAPQWTNQHIPVLVHASEWRFPGQALTEE